MQPVIRWLDVVCASILLMVLVGGVTRLTESGLSMVTWEPILGIIPPRNEAEWQMRFDQYRAYPEYRLLRKGMTLDEFKFIYFWEYLHRLLGRLVGVLYAIPLAWFWMTGRVRGRLAGLLVVGLLLGGLQGVVGWWMVKSGLYENPYVSPFRLAIHLGLALFILCYLWWIRLALSLPRPGYSRSWLKGVLSEPADNVLAPSQAFSADERLRAFTGAFAVILALQIFYGALTAGLNAGYMFNTFPLMMGRVFPPGMWGLSPGWLNLFENATTVQWIHRALGWILLGMAIAAVPLVRRAGTAWLARRALQAVIGLTTIQFALGVATLVLKVPLWLGVSHQVNAALLVLAVVTLWYAAPASTGSPATAAAPAESPVAVAQR